MFAGRVHAGVFPPLALSRALLNNYAAYGNKRKIKTEVFPMDKKYGRASLIAAALAALALAFAAPRLGAGGFRVREFSPRGEAQRSAEIKCVFSGAVVSGDVIGAPLAPGAYPLTFSPEISGFGRWTDASTFALAPSGGLAAATRFSASAAEGLRDLQGRPLSGAKEFSFSTPPLEFLGVKQIDFSEEEGSVTFELSFSLPVEPRRFGGYARVSDEKGRAVDFSTESGGDAKKLLLKLSGVSDGEATLEIAEGFASAAGPLGLVKARSAKLKCSPVLEVRDSNAFSEMDGGRIVIETTAPVDLARAAAFVELSPKADFSVEPAPGGFAIFGAFRPQERVRVEVKKGLPCAARPSAALAESWSRAFIFPDVAAQLRFSDGGRLLSPSGSLRLPIESVNVDKIRVIVNELYANNIAYAMRGGDDPNDRGLSRLAAEREYLVRGRPNAPARRALDMAPLIGGRRGVFMVRAFSEDERGFCEASCVVNVSDLGLSVTLGAKEALARVLSVSSGAPLAGVGVSLLSWENQIIGRGVSGADGTAKISLKSPAEGGHPVIAIASNGKDTAYLRFDGGLYRGNDDFDSSGEEWLRGGYSAYCYTPRDIFRPGDEVPVMAVVRGADGRAPRPFPLTVKLYSPEGRVWASKGAMLTKEGTLLAEFKLPPEAPTGGWSAEIYAPGANEPIGRRDFYTEEFAAPRLFVEAKGGKARLTADESCEIELSGRYTFGNPAAAMRYEAELSTKRRELSYKGWKGFSFADEEAEFVPENDFIASGALNAGGLAKFALGGEGRASRSALDLALRCGVMEDGGRWTYKTLTIAWYPSEFLAGVEVRRDVSPHRELSFRAAAVTPDGKGAPAAELKYSLFRRVSRAVTFESGGRGARDTLKELIPRGSGSLKLSGGVGSASVNIKEAGEYVLRVETPDGKSRASALIYAYGAGGAEAQLPDVALITMDKKIYKVGETAKIKVKSPFAGSLLISAETTDVIWSAAKRMEGREAEFSLPVTEKMRPNAWITAQVVRPAQRDGAPARAAGAAPLMVDNAKSRLGVEIEKRERLKQGKNKISVHVKDSEGRGRAADVTLMIVDETVLGLTGYASPAPWKHFSARRALGTETYDIYGSLITPERAAEALRAAGGGAADENALLKSSLSPVQARRFRLLSIVKRARSGAGGRCDVEVEMPEFSGAVRIMAVAAAADAEGSAESAAQAGGEIVTEFSLPRFAADGDEFLSAARIFNNARRDVSVNFTIKCENSGARLTTKEKTSRSVKIAEGSSAVLPFAFKAEGSGVVKVVCETEEAGSGEKTRSVTEFPVRPAAPRVTESRSAVVEPGASLSFNVPDDPKKSGYAEARVTLSAAPAMSLSALAEFLVTYPYGCTEQTVSSAWALLLQPELVKEIDPALADRAALAARIEKIAKSQSWDGGFPRWSGEGASSPWESLYAAHFLFEARRLGEKVPQEALRAAQDYARALLPAMPEDDGDAAWRATLSRRAYAAFVLTLAGEPPLGWMENLRGKIGEIEPDGRLLLACAYAAAGEKAEAKKIVGERVAASRERPGRDENYASALRDKALSLLASAYIDPAGADAAARAGELLKALEKNGRYNTQEGGFAMAALGRWLAGRPRDGVPSGSLSHGGKRELVDEKKRSAALSGTGSYTAENGGKSRLYAAWSLSYIPEGLIPARDDGIELRQSVTDRSGKEIGAEVARGEALTALVTLTPKGGALRSVAAVLPLPAGFEIENPRLTGGEEENAGGVRSEIRDDRLILFVDELDKPLKWRYSLRAVTAGSFAVPQIYAECMYDAGVSSVSGGGNIKVNEGK